MLAVGAWVIPFKLMLPLITDVVPAAILSAEFKLKDEPGAMLIVDPEAMLSSEPDARLSADPETKLAVPSITAELSFTVAALPR